MKIYQNAPVRPNMGGTQTYEDFAKFLGTQPHKLGIMSKMYPNLTASYLTESLLNVYYNDAKAGNRFQNINSLLIEWELDVNQIKHITFAAVPQGDGKDGSDIIMAFTERYYEKNDTFRVEKTKQTFFVKSAPYRKSDRYWEVIVSLVGNDSVIDTTGTQIGDKTRFISNYQPELHEIGYSKYQSNVEKMRNYIATHRNDIDYSSLFKLQEEVFIGIGKGGTQKGETLYKLDKSDKIVLDSFLVSRNNGLVFGKDNHDANGRPANYDDQGRPIHMSDGLISQTERYAGKYGYAKLSIPAFEKVMAGMRQRTGKAKGNKWMFIVNDTLYNQMQVVLRKYLFEMKTDGTFFYSKQAGGEVTVGATFETYIYAGNQLTIQPDEALSLEYPDTGYGICIDLTADAFSGPAVGMFSLKGKELIRNTIQGVGGLDGGTSGPVDSPVAGSKIIYHGYASLAVFNPYRSFILQENN